MKCLEQLLEQECSENRLEGFLVFYSCSPSPDLKPMSMSFSSISAYADSLNKQFGIPSPNVKPSAPSSLATAKTFNAYEVLNSLKKPYKSRISEEELSYANSLAKQFNAPSPVVKPVTSHAPSPQTFNPGPIIEAVKNPVCSSSCNYSPNVTSSPKRVQGTFAYKTPEFKAGFKAPEPVIKISEPLKLDLKPEKRFYDSFKKEHKIRSYGLTKPDPIYDLFKKNELPKVYDQVSKGLNLKKHSVRTITFTNPLKSEEDVSPSFLPFTRELRLPAIKPKMIPFDNIPQKRYNKMLNNAFLPHELGHAKVEEKYGKHYPDIDVNGPGLAGFQEHLVDSMSFDSVKNTPQLPETKNERIKFENMWVTSKNKYLSRAEENYLNFLSFEKKASFVPGKQATINMLGEPLLKQNYDTTLKNVLNFKYGDDPHKETVYNNINEMSNFYQQQAIKLVHLSKKDSIISNFQAKRILSNIEKKSIKFAEGL